MVHNPNADMIYLYTGGTYPTYGPQIVVTYADTGQVHPTIHLVYEHGVVRNPDNSLSFYPPGAAVPIPGNSDVTLRLNAGENANSADLAGLLVTITMQWGHELTAADDTDHVDNPMIGVINVDGTPPCEKCLPPSA